VVAEGLPRRAAVSIVSGTSEIMRGIIAMQVVGLPRSA
jgi:hypothetical protein